MSNFGDDTPAAIAFLESLGFTIKDSPYTGCVEITPPSEDMECYRATEIADNILARALEVSDPDERISLGDCRDVMIEVAKEEFFRFVHGNSTKGN